MSPTVRSVAVAALVIMVCGSCSTGDKPSAQKTSDRREVSTSPGAPGTALAWGSCRSDMASSAGLECATLSVPIDPADPDGPTTEIALARKSSSSADRVGSLVMNPGGPGGSGIEFLASVAGVMPSDVADSFDLVSFDPRGVGESSPVHCLTDEQKDESLEGDLSPDTEAELERAENDQRTLLQGCDDKNQSMIGHMSTADVAADLEQIRIALGDEKLTYAGFSYGTLIGAAYATLHPDRVRALVLDGAVDPQSTTEEEATVQATGFENTLASFVKACNSDARCAIAPDAAGAIESTRAALESDPVEVSGADGERILGADLFIYAIATGLYATDSWGSMATAIANVREGGAESLLSLVDRQTGRKPDGSYDNSSDAQSMVSCSDDTERPDDSEVTAPMARIAAAAPTFGPLLATSMISCLDWPEPANPLPELSAPDAPPILVVGTVGDPATPYEWAEDMTAALGPRTTLLTYEGDGHTAFLRAGECIDDAISAYLIDLEVPTSGTRCPAQSNDTGFGGIREMLVEELTGGGVPRTLAECLVDGMIREVGEEELESLVLGNDADAITKLATRLTLECATKGD